MKKKERKEEEKLEFNKESQRFTEKQFRTLRGKKKKPRIFYKKPLSANQNSFPLPPPKKGACA